MKSISVFCGSNSGTQKTYTAQAMLLGRELARREIGLIYGGGKIGMMGAVADGVLSNGGKAVGVIPDFLMSKEIAHDGLTELIVHETMHDRKAMMNELSDGVVVLPGGFGTMDELFEMLTWAQLGLHKKPIGILNIEGYYDSMLRMIQEMVDAGFVKRVNQEMFMVSDKIHELLTEMNNYVAPEVEKWIKNESVNQQLGSND